MRNGQMKKEKVLKLMKSAVAVAAVTGMLLSGSSFTYLAEANDNASSGNQSVSTLANLVVFVNFADTTTHTHLNNPSNGIYCFMDDPKIAEYFTGEGDNAKALSSYIDNISYGQQQVENIIPQYNSDTNKVTPVTLSYGIDHYGNDSTNGDSNMIQEVVRKLNESGIINSSTNLDRNGDGSIDNLMLVIASGTDEQNAKFNGHMAYYSGSDAINEKQVSGYTVIPEYRSYQSITGQSGVIIHEYLHSLGYSDLYTSESGSYSSRYPVGQWDIMASASDYLQYPLAYYRSTVSKWFSIPTVTTDQKSYTIRAVSATDSSNKDNQAVIIKTDYSTNEFFVVEYRKQAEKGTSGYDEIIPGSGLVIYRINTSAQKGNMTAPPYGAYVFRQGDSLSDSIELASNDALTNTSFFSAESGRTSYGNADKSKGISDNAITYSDGTNSGIVISNIGSASGDTISFDIDFAEVNDQSGSVDQGSGTDKGSTSDLGTDTDKEEEQVPEGHITYKTHVQDYGWESKWKSDGALSGTTGQSKRLEGIYIKLSDPKYLGAVVYRTHIQDYGWESGWQENGSLSGTTGQSKRLEAIQIKLTNEMAEKYDIYYRVHAQDYGWLDWAKNGAAAGTAGYSKRLEGIEIKLVKKGEAAPGSTETPYITPGLVSLVSYQTHVQDYGWQGLSYDGAMSGTTGQSKRLEGIKISLTDPSMVGDICYRTHIQDYGWESGWKKNGALSGTTGKSKRLEAIQIKLTGDMTEKYDIYYRVHVQDVGWLDWAKNGESAGTAGCSLRLESIQIVLVTKGGKAPGSVERAYFTYSNSPLVNYTKLSPNHSGTRTHTIDRITPHCVVGQCTAEWLGDWFSRSSLEASSNYGIDKNGRIGMYVEEKNRSWCSSSNANDQRAVTIECASDTYHPYAMKEIVYQRLIDLCTDICKRNGKTKLLWLGDKSTSLNYTPASNEMVLTVHRWFANKSCPGDWLYSRLPDLANQVTARLQS